MTARLAELQALLARVDEQIATERRRLTATRRLQAALPPLLRGPEHILFTTACEFRLTVPEILSTSRVSDAADARAVIAWVAHRADLTPSVAAGLIGRPNSSTVAAMRDRVNHNRHLRARAETVLARLQRHRGHIAIGAAA